MGSHVLPGSMWLYVRPFYNHVLQDKTTKTRQKRQKQSHKNTPCTTRQEWQKQDKMTEQSHKNTS